MTRLAAVDCGTNATRVLIADVAPGGRVREVTRQLVITRMGAALGASGVIGADALDRVADALGRYAELCDYFGVDDVTVLATSAARDAANADDLQRTVKAALGVPAIVLTGDEEAAATHGGALTGLAVDGPALVVDLGGGSTEFAVGEPGAARTASLDLGSVRLTEQHLQEPTPTPAAVDAAVHAVDEALGSLRARLPLADVASMVAVAGTALTLGALHAGIADADDRTLHGMWLGRTEVLQLTEDLVFTPTSQIAELQAVTPGREDVIGAGALILSRVLELVELPGMVISRHDLLDDAVRRLAADRTRPQAAAGRRHG